MARKPNYKFERSERDRAKAAKKAARLEAKKSAGGTDVAAAETDAESTDAPAPGADSKPD